MPRRRPVHRELALDSSHWRRDGLPKTRYASRSEALSVAEELDSESENPLDAYPCPYCRGWHMGGRSSNG